MQVEVVVVDVAEVGEEMEVEEVGAIDELQDSQASK